MAPCRRRRSNSSVLVSVRESHVGYLVFRFDVKRLFSDEDDHKSNRRREVLPLPRCPVACFRRPLRFPMELVASPGGDKIVAATTDGHIMVYDATRSQYTHDHSLCCFKRWPVLIAMTLSSRSSSSGAAAERRRRRHDVSMLVATSRPDLLRQEPSFEAVRLTSVGRLQPLPVPPPLVSPPHALPDSWRLYGYRSWVASYFVASGRVWLSVGEAGKGTYSLDMAAPNYSWRHEGTWMLPLKGRAVYAPDLGRLLLGMNFEHKALCAIDMEARPPVIRQQWAWHTLYPTEDEGYSPQQDYFFDGFNSLAYLGGGRLCISWCTEQVQRVIPRTILALTAVELTMSNGPAGERELLLRKRRSRCYSLPPKTGEATVLPVL